MIPESMIKALKQLNSLLYSMSGDWMVGGSCGLLMQGVSITAKPRDLDIYTDETYKDSISLLLRKYALDMPQYSETSIYQSYLSHYELKGIVIEHVGGFKVKNEGSAYTVEVSGLRRYGTILTLENTIVHVMPLAHEFVFNLLRKRQDRFIPIADKIRSNSNMYIPALIEIINRNHFSKIHLEMMSELLSYPLLNESKGKI